MPDQLCLPEPNLPTLPVMIMIIAAPRPFAVLWNQWFVPSPLWIAAGFTVPLSRAQRTIKSFGEFVI